MSFYNQTNPVNFVSQNPSVLLERDIQFLRNGFQQPSGGEEDIDIVGNGVTYTTESVIGRYIVRTGLDGQTSNDYTPSAAELIAALNENQYIRQNNQLNTGNFVRRGFYFDLSIYNDDDNDSIYLYGGNNVIIGVLPEVTILPGTFAVLRFQVVNATEGFEEIYVTNLSSYNAIPLNENRVINSTKNAKNKIVSNKPVQKNVVVNLSYGHTKQPRGQLLIRGEKYIN